jgi:hypothetical protein
MILKTLSSNTILNYSEADCFEQLVDFSAYINLILKMMNNMKKENIHYSAVINRLIIIGVA